MPFGGGGGGGGGLTSVTTDGTLAGAGTVASPLSVKGWPLTYFQDSTNDQSFTFITTNSTYIQGFVLPYGLTFSHIAINVATADAGKLYDLGIYTKAGALVADIGPTNFAVTGTLSFSTVQGVLTLSPALYLFAMTGNNNVLGIGYGAEQYCWVVNAAVASSSGGQLPSSIPAQVTGTPAAHPVFLALF
jgi:hypothetical protein